MATRRQPLSIWWQIEPATSFPFCVSARLILADGKIVSFFLYIFLFSSFATFFWHFSFFLHSLFLCNFFRTFLIASFAFLYFFLCSIHVPFSFLVLFLNFFSFNLFLVLCQIMETLFFPKHFFPVSSISFSYSFTSFSL